MELDSAGGAAAFPPMQEHRGTRSRSAGRLVLVRDRRLDDVAGDDRIRREAAVCTSLLLVVPSSRHKGAGGDDRIQAIVKAEA
jgi:hypothetical protein